MSLSFESCSHRIPRVDRIEHQDRACFLKIARFGLELPWLAREIKAYHDLSRRNSTLAPRILGYAFEESLHQVTGFIIEDVTGRRPGIEDLETCRKALQQLHDFESFMETSTFTMYSSRTMEQSYRLEGIYRWPYWHGVEREKG